MVRRGHFALHSRVVPPLTAGDSCAALVENFFRSTGPATADTHPSLQDRDNFESIVGLLLS